MPKRMPQTWKQPILSRADFARVLGFLGDLYQPRTVDEFRDCLLSGLEKLVPNLGHAWGLLDLKSGALSGNSHNLPGFVAPEAIELTLLYAQQHPVHKFYRQTGRSDFASTADTGTFAQLERTGFYNELCRPHGIYDGCGSIFSTEDGSTFMIGVLSKRAFPDRQKELLNALSTHIQQAYRNAEHLQQLRERNHQLESALQCLNGGVLTVNFAGTLQFASGGAGALMRKYFGASSGGALPEPLRSWMRSQTAQLSAATDLPSPRAPLAISRDAGKLIVRYFSEPYGALLTVEEQAAAITPESLVRLGLTRRQAEVLSYLAMGKTNPEIGTILGISPRTVEKHVEQLLIRLHVENRTAAAAIALETAHYRHR